MSPQPAASAPQTPRVSALPSIHTAQRPAGATDRFDLRQLNRAPASPPLGRAGSAAGSLAARGGPSAPVPVSARGAVRPVAAVPGPAGPAGAGLAVVDEPGGRRGLAVDRSAWAAWLDGELLDLTYLEFEVLDFLVRHPGRVYSRAALLRHVWGHHVDDDPGQAGRTVDVLVTRLRRKLGPEHRLRIETVRRVGYRYRPAATDLLS